MSCRLSGTARSFGVGGSKSLVQQYEVIFVEQMGPNITHPEHFVPDVVEHPKSDSCVEGVPRAWPGCGFRAVFLVPIRGIRAGRDL